VPAQAELVADDAPLGTNCVEAEGVDPRLDDATEGLCRDLVVRCAGLSAR
jgi:hypothetical protein